MTELVPCGNSKNCKVFFRLLESLLSSTGVQSESTYLSSAVKQHHQLFSRHWANWMVNWPSSVSHWLPAGQFTVMKAAVKKQLFDSSCDLSPQLSPTSPELTFVPSQ